MVYEYVCLMETATIASPSSVFETPLKKLKTNSDEGYFVNKTVSRVHG